MPFVIFIRCCLLLAACRIHRHPFGFWYIARCVSWASQVILSCVFYLYFLYIVYISLFILLHIHAHIHTHTRAPIQSTNQHSDNVRMHTAANMTTDTNASRFSMSDIESVFATIVYKNCVCDFRRLCVCEWFKRFFMWIGAVYSRIHLHRIAPIYLQSYCIVVYCMQVKSVSVSVLAKTGHPRERKKERAQDKKKTKQHQQ